MALAVRELELVLIARDSASATIARVGGAIAILGGAMVLAGGKAIREFGEMAREAATFEQAIALAVTQADDLGASIENVSGIVNRVGSTLPVPFEELSEALYDIFSTLTRDQLGSLEDAEAILGAFARSAVAGQAPVRDIGRSVIAWLNALDQPATLGNVNRLLDIQFELVRRGAGTYGEFAGEVGKAIPAFVAGGQNVETFGGSLAFLTKNGLSAAMASTSAARAVELMFSPKAIGGLKDIGVAVEDGNGNFRQMNDIIRDMLPHFDNLSDADKKIKFKEIFGTGRIQARRFFDLAIPNFEEFDALIGDMAGSAGSVEEAFALMMGTPLSKMDLFKNKWELLRRELGERFLKSMEEKVFPILDKLFAWWDGLSESVKDNIATWLAWGAAISVVVGALLVVVGIGAIFVGILKAFSGGSAIAGLFKLGAMFGWIGLLIAAVIAIGILLWKNWEKIGPILSGIWQKISDAVKNFIDDNKAFFVEMGEKAKETWQALLGLWEAIWNRAKEIWDGIWGAMLVFWDRWGDTIMETWRRTWENIQDILRGVWDVIIGIIEFFTALFEGDWGALWDSVKDIAQGAWKIILGLWRTFLDILATAGEIAWAGIKVAAKWAWERILDILKWAWDGIVSLAETIWNGVVDFFKGIWESITGSASDAIEGRGGLVNFFRELPGKIIDAATGLGKKLITWISNALAGILEFALAWASDDLLPWFGDLPGKIVDAIPNVARLLWNIGDDLLHGLWLGIQFVWDNYVLFFFRDLPQKILDALPDVLSWLWNTGWDIMTGLKDGIIWVWDNFIYPWLTELPTKIATAAGTLFGVLMEAGGNVMRSLLDGITNLWDNNIKPWFENLPDNILAAIPATFNALKTVGKNMIQAIQDGAEIIWENVTSWFSERPDLSAEAIGDVRDVLWQKGQDLIAGFFRGAWEWWTQTYIPWVISLPGKVISAIGNVTATLWQQGQDIIHGFNDGSDNWYTEKYLPWVKSLPSLILAAIGEVGSTLFGAGSSLMSGMYNGFTSWYFSTYLPWARNLPGYIVQAIGNVSSTLFATGSSLMWGMMQGSTSWYTQSYLPWVLSLPGKIVSAIGNLGNLLWNAGRSVIQGLWDGMKSKWSSVTSWLGGLNPAKWFNDINPYKGHAIKNLVGIGEQVMKGLNVGMMQGWEKNTRWLQNINPAMEVAFAGSAVRGLTSDASNVYNNDQGQTFQFGDIISQADPDEIANAIAWQVRMA